MEKSEVEKRAIPSTGGNYFAGSDGSIWSKKRATTKGGKLKGYLNKHNGYVYVSISINGTRKTKRVHVLVAEAFLGESNGKQVNHIDGDKTNNNIKNLEYCTQSENMKHAYRIGLEKRNGIKVIDLDTNEVFNTLTQAAESVGGKRGIMVRRVCLGKKSHYRNHHFAYLSDYENGTIPKFTGRNTKKASYSLWQ